MDPIEMAYIISTLAIAVIMYWAFAKLLDVHQKLPTYPTAMMCVCSVFVILFAVLPAFILIETIWKGCV